jgi:NitT/TauT family transport system substrate-binding protein
VTGRTKLVCGLVALALLSSACAGSEARARGIPGVLRLGVLATLTHAPAHVGIGAGIFRRVLAPTRVEVTTFDSGTDAGIALLSGSIDAAYIGPWPSALLYLRSRSVAIVSGATTGGASFVVRANAGIEGPSALHDRRIAVPGANNTQDIALRSWLHGNGLRARDEGGDVSIVGVGGSELLPLFRRDQLDGAWMPEPYPTYLVAQGVAVRLVDEASLWPEGGFLTTDLVVSTVFMDAHPDVVRALVEANVASIRLCQSEPERAKEIAAEQLIAHGVPELDRGVLDAAWAEMAFTWDPLPDALRRVAEEGRDAGALSESLGSLAGAYRLDDLNDVLNDDGLSPVEVPA